MVVVEKHHKLGTNFAESLSVHPVPLLIVKCE